MRMYCRLNIYIYCLLKVLSLGATKKLLPRENIAEWELHPKTIFKTNFISFREGYEIVYVHLLVIGVVNKN